MSKLKVGDKVRVRKDLELNKIYGGITLIESMFEMKGDILTIKNIYECIDVCENTYAWGEDMLELHYRLSDHLKRKGIKQGCKVVFNDDKRIGVVERIGAGCIFIEDINGEKWRIDYAKNIELLV